MQEPLPRPGLAIRCSTCATLARICALLLSMTRSVCARLFAQRRFVGWRDAGTPTFGGALLGFLRHPNLLRYSTRAALAWICALLLVPICAQAAGELRYGGDRDFPPFEFLDDAGRPQGFQIELLNAIERVGGFRVSIRLDEWKTIEADFRAGKLDAVAMSHARTRAQWAAFAQPHATPAMAIYHRAGGTVPVALADLAGRTVAIPDSEPMRETRADFFSAEQYRFATFASPHAALEAVRDGQADYALMPRAYGDRAIAGGSLPGVAGSDFNLLLQAYGFAVAPGNTALLQGLDNALRELERSGELEALRTKWLSSHRAAAVRTALEEHIAWQRIVLVLLGLTAAVGLSWLAVKLRRRARQAHGERLRRRDAESALRSAEEKLARAFTNNPDAMLITEHGTGIVRDVNQALCRLVGAEQEALLGRPVQALEAIVDPLSLAVLRGALRQDGAIDSAPLQVRRADGELRSCLVSAEVFAAAEGQQVFSIIRDVTEQLRADEELRSGYEALAESARAQARELAATQASLAQSNEELQALAFSVSHDLRAPLRAIRSLSEMLREDLQAGRTEEATRHVARIARATHRMDAMIGALTRLARVGQRDLERTRIDMVKLAREAWSLVSAAEPARHVTLLVADLPPALGDGPLLAQVWQNLLANAFNYTARTAEPKIGIDAFMEGGRQWYRVTDNGVGFDMSYASHLFEPFQRLHSQSDFPGTGIGLSIVQRIVRRHGGEIRARGNVGVGAVFEFTLEGTQASGAAEASGTS